MIASVAALAAATAFGISAVPSSSPGV